MKTNKLPTEGKGFDKQGTESALHDAACSASSEYRYLGDFAACEIWAARHMICNTCRVSWTGCWDNFMCPECGEGELPSCELTAGMALGKLLQPNVNVEATRGLEK